MKLRPFHNPIPPDCVRMFAHPKRGHVFGVVVSHAGETLACNGQIALRVTRGHWAAEDFPAASEAFLERFLAIPWGQWPDPLGSHWRALDDERGRLVSARDKYVRTGACHIAPLVAIQLIARLPRCEVWTATRDGEHLPFRFTGGTGLVGFHNWRKGQDLAVRLSILQTSYHYDGLPKQRGGVKLDLGLPGWPPPEAAE